MSETAVLKTEGRIAHITLNRPEKLNAFTAEMHARLRDALTTLEARDDIACLVIVGSGRAFCTGQDLNERARAPGDPPVDLGETLSRDVNPLIRRLRALPFPIIAGVQGAAAGAGASLALAADILIVSRSAKISFGFCKIGLMPDGGPTWLLPRLVGPARAAHLVLTGNAVSGEDAAAMGLASRVVDDDALAGAVEDLAAYFAKQPAAALAATKQALAAAWSNTLEEQLELERRLQQTLGFSSDYAEGVAAFLERRTPQFGGAAR